MSKKRDPVIAVLKYFQEADLPLAEQALSLAQQTLRARAGASRHAPSRPVAAKKTPPLPGPVATVGGSRE